VLQAHVAQVQTLQNELESLRAQLAFGSSPITRARKAQTLMPQSFCPFNTEEERTLLAKGEETTTS
jgi:hypothetical protein